MLAYDYPLLGFFWSMLIIFFWVTLIMILFRVIADIFRNKDMGGAAKAAWLFFVIVAPWLGVLVYLLANGSDMAGRDIQRQQAQQAAFDSYVQTAAGTATSPAEELAKLADLHERGVLTDAEFAEQKAKALA